MTDDITTKTIERRDEWNALLGSLPHHHILQTWEWGDFKRDTVGWMPERVAFYAGDALIGAASLLTRRVGGLTVMYTPKGPALDYTNPAHVTAVLGHLAARARRRRALWLKIEPDVIGATGFPDGDDDRPHPTGSALVARLRGGGWRFSGDQVQFRNTLTIDLTRDEDDILMAMSQNTRRKVRTAQKKGVTVRDATPDDLPVLYALYKTTGQRDDFLIRPATYYEKAWRDFMHAGLAHALIAEYDGQPIAHVILFHFGRVCWYFYGASADVERQRMPNYLLQWEAMRWARANGYTVYDMWGAPNDFQPDDPMWGVYEFKRGFRGEIVRHIGAWDYAPNPLLYRLYTGLWPRLRGLLRRFR